MRRFVLPVSADGALVPMLCTVGRPFGLVVMRRKFAVLLTADRAGRLFRTGCRAARVDGQLLPANIALVILVVVRTLA